MADRILLPKGKTMKNKLKIISVLTLIVIISAAFVACTQNNDVEYGSLAENPFMSTETSNTIGEDSTEGNTNQYALPIVPIE